MIAVSRALICIFIAANIGPRSGPGTGKKASYGSGKQTLRLKSNGTAAIEEVDNVRTQAEENINKLLETFMGINDSELGKATNSSCSDPFLTVQHFSLSDLGPRGWEDQHDGAGRGH